MSLQSAPAHGQADTDAAAADEHDARDAEPGLQRGSWRWYWNRVRVMDPFELPSRAVGAVDRMRLEAAARLGVRPPPPRPPLRPAAAWLAGATRTPRVDRRAYLDEADMLLHGRIPRLGGGEYVLGRPADWRPTLALLAGPDEEHDFLRQAIELHRHGHLVRLAQACRLGAGAAYREALLDQLDRWIDQCAFSGSAAWASALDAGLRLVNWSIAWQLLEVEEAPAGVPAALQRRWCDAVYEHAAFVHRHRSRHSSANNHLLGELLGLVAAGATWPLWPEVVRWGEAAAREMQVELFEQTHADGVSREQASWYQAFVFELFAVFVAIRRAAGHADDARVMRRLGGMARFLAALRDHGGHLSHHGDADQATALPLAVDAVDPCTRVLSLAVGLGAAPELAPLVDRRDDAAAWLMGGAPTAPTAPIATREDTLCREVRRALPRAFPEGGYFLLGSGFGTPQEVMLTFDAGPLGYLGIAAHGHADALSVRLSVGGRPVLVDRGTHGYNHAPAWRRYFRGTSAHNTVTVDGADQSEYGGPFLWLRKARCQLVHFESGDEGGRVEASHDGYGRLVSPLVHTRCVQWQPQVSCFRVTDQLQSRGTHQAVVAWHFDPGCNVRVERGGAVVTWEGGSLRLRVANGRGSGHWQLLHGGRARHGWHSPAFGVRVAAPTLLWRTAVAGTQAIETVIEIERQEP